MKSSLCVLSFVFLFGFVASTNVQNRSKPPTIEYLGRHAEYINLTGVKSDSRMFYFFFQSQRSQKDPVVVWLNGGPGAGSEFGPVTLSDNTISLTWNKYGWDQVSNILFIDNPVGTGFSHVSNDKDLCRDEECVGKDLYTFIQKFFKKYPKLVKNPFFITGESYAGHYIPAFATKIHQENKNKNNIYINLKGLAIGNGITNPGIQYTAFPDYALEMGLIQLNDYHDIILNGLLPCIESIRICESFGGMICNTSFLLCQGMYNHIIHLAGNRNDYDLRKKCLKPPCYNFDILESFLNRTEVKRAFGAKNVNFKVLNNTILQAFTFDRMKNLAVGIPELLNDGIRILIYAGEFDIICNWLGNLRWVRALEWKGQEKFIKSSIVPFLVDGVSAGELIKYKALAFLKVYNAGHTVPQDQPKASLHMLKTWMDGHLGS